MTRLPTIYSFARRYTHAVKAALGRLATRPVPLTGWKEPRNCIPFVDTLSPADLSRLNQLLDWQCFVLDSHGRRFGNAAWAGKRCEPQAIPDRRVLLLHERFDLSDKQVVEVGCFEGVHTVGLCRYAKRVHACDARIENVVKTIVRCALFGLSPMVFVCDLEATPVTWDMLSADVMFHVGVLYHLRDPVRHLQQLNRHIRRGLLLDTHIASDADAVESYTVDGRTYRYRRYREFGRDDPFSGMHGHSKWLLLEDIRDLLQRAGFPHITVHETRQERHGPRVLLTAQRK